MLRELRKDKRQVLFVCQIATQPPGGTPSGSGMRGRVLMFFAADGMAGRVRGCLVVACRCMRRAMRMAGPRVRGVRGMRTMAAGAPMIDRLRDIQHVAGRDVVGAKVIPASQLRGGHAKPVGYRDQGVSTARPIAHVRMHHFGRRNGQHKSLPGGDLRRGG
jgi:hypothetical protein